MSVDDDRTEILRLHHEWWEANRDMDHERMRVCFAHGAATSPFNLNGHPYYGSDDKVELWKAYGQDALTIPDLGPDEHLRLEIRGDMAWLACENVIGVAKTDKVDVAAIPSVPFRVRSTEIYQRDDGAGNAVWRIWHIHCSPSAAPDEPRLPFGDTYESRA